jgi:4-amino-4-deoxy-L-arabinose transferase-like glycosyltransferase
MGANDKPLVATRVALGLILAAGLALRLWYGGFGLRLDRFEDEQHSWPNVQSILETGNLAPVKSYYPYPLFNVPPAALIAIAEKLSSSIGDEPWTAVTADGTVSPRALFLSRVWPIAYGTLAIFLTFLIGQRVFSTKAGLIGALLLAFSPQAIHSSGYFKPDSQLLCMTLLALLLSLRAVERRKIGGYVLAGLGVTLAASSKAIGVEVAVPLVVAALITAWRRHRDLLLLCVAGLSSALSFVLLNPYWRHYPAWLANLRHLYEIQARARGQTQLSVPWRTVKFLLEPAVQSPWLAGLGLLGLLGLLVWLLRNRAIEPQWLPRLMFLTFPIVYVAAYALTTAYLKRNNFLVVLPFLFLATGWVLVTAWKSATETSDLLQRPIFALLACAAVVVLAGSPGISYTYCAVVPPTSLLAKQFLARHLEPPEGRLVYQEDPQLARPSWEGWPRQFARNRAAFERIVSARDLPREALAMADGLAVLSTSLEQSDSEPLSQWLSTFSPAQVRIYKPEIFRARGPEMTAAFQIIPQLAAPLPLGLDRCTGRRDCLMAVLPRALSPREIPSLIVYVKQSHFKRGAKLPEIRLGGELVSLTWTSWRRDTKEHHFVSTRVVPDVKEPRVVIEAAGRPLRPRDFRVELCRWKLDPRL